jgi:serine/threonine protein kinase
LKIGFQKVLQSFLQERQKYNFFVRGGAQVWQSILSQRIDFHAAELEQVSAAARDLLKGLLERDPDARLTPKQALEHPWIKV